MARRNAFRAPGRTLLIAVLIGLPVLAAVMIDLLIRTAGGTVPDRVRWSMGNADARIVVTDQKRTAKQPVEELYENDILYPAEPPKPQRDPRAVDLEKFLPAGSRLIPDRDMNDGVSVTSGDRKISGGLIRMRGTDPLTEGIALIRSGRYPRSGDEIAVSSDLANRLGLSGPGGKASIRGEKETVTVTVTGIIDNPSALGGQDVFVSDTFALPGFTDKTHASYLVDLPEVSLPELKKLVSDGFANGIAILPREARLHPEDWREQEPGGSNIFAGLLDPSTLQAVALGGLVIGFGLLEIVLLAGAAFAVGARRQTRELGLLGVVGGTGKDIRRAVLAQGLVLGLIGAVGGVALGAGLPMILRPLSERLLNHQILTWSIAPPDYLGFGLVGLLSGLAAALMPAIGAGKMSPIAALAGRFRATSGSARVPKLGLVLLIAGLASGIAGSLLLTQQFGDFRRAAESQRTGMYVSTGGVGLGVMLGLLGLTLLAVGLVRTMPAIVSWIGALAGRLPLSPRLSFRDASRHRHRTAPAAAAIMIAVAGSAGAAFMAASNDAQERLTYQPTIPMGDAILYAVDQKAPDGVPAKLKAALPGAHYHPLRDVLRAKSQWPKGTDESMNSARVEAVPQLREDGTSMGESSQIMVVDPEALRGVPGKNAEQAIAALRAGRVVAMNDGYVFPDGKVHLTIGEDFGEGMAKVQKREIPVHRFQADDQYSMFPSVMVSEAAARKLGLEPAAVQGVYIDLPTSVDQTTMDKAAAAVGDESASGIEFETGFRSSQTIAMLIIGGISAFVTLVGVAISVALSNAESRPDLATLAAIGAQPRRRRSLAASQAILVAGLGCLTGLGLGAFLGFIGRGIMGTATFAVPWDTLLIMGIAVPVFAALCAALLTRSKLPLMRRVE